jgi:UDP-3-O-[3-hydroxymyristoyl] N-acetylglucosamine deacetylase
MTLHPSDINTGICFLRTGLPGGRERLIEARAQHVAATELCTVIGDPTGAAVGTIEHLMAALVGLGIDNVLVEIDGAEVPIMDGSSAAFVDAIEQAGLLRQPASRRVVRVLKPVRVEHGRAFAELSPRSRGFSLDVEIEFPTAVIGRQRRVVDLTPESFRAELSRARTFGFMRDVEMLWKKNLALGASLENTIAIGDDCVVNPEGLRFPDEFVRHKMLDAVGDLALAGAALQGAYRAYCPGHKINAMVLAALLADRSAYMIEDVVTPRRVVPHAEIGEAAVAFAPDMN